jgi:hypothetical protein
MTGRTEVTNSHALKTCGAAHHEEAKTHEDHEARIVYRRNFRVLRAPSCLRDKTSSATADRDARVPAYTVAAALAFALACCGRAPATAPPVANAAAPVATTSPAAGSAAPHGDHAPHHGGVVMMKGEDLHYEVVLDPSGRSHRVYFTDAVREDLPASIASEVVLTIKRPSAPEERVALQIDETGESWVGSGTPVDNAAKTTTRVAFSIKGEAYWIDVPFTHL